MRDLKDKIYFYTEGEFLEMLEEIVNATSKDKSNKTIYETSSRLANAMMLIT